MATDKRDTKYYVPPRFLTSDKLPLPSFGLHVTKSSAKAVAIPKSTSPLNPASPSGDAISISYTYERDNLSLAEQDRPPLDLELGYLRRLLLEIFSREEYEIFESRYISRRREKKPVRDSGPDAQVRLSDLRLATAIGRTFLNRELEETMKSLELPITRERVLNWKWETLKAHEPAVRRDGGQSCDWTKEGILIEGRRLIAVTFAAAALCLFLDLGARGLHDSSRERLRERILELWSVIERFAASLNKGTEGLEKLVTPAPSRGGLPKDPIKKYTALHLYRMNRGMEEIAEWIGITPYKEQTGRGTRDWKNKIIKNHLVPGVEVEEERLPRAAEVFARRNEEAVKQQAVEAYREYSQTKSDPPVGYWLPPLVDVGEDLVTGILADTGEEVHRAYVQLGSCIEFDIDPIPSTKT
jgi:hypothetical protein